MQLFLYHGLHTKKHEYIHEHYTTQHSDMVIIEKLGNDMEETWKLIYIYIYITKVRINDMIF